MAQDNSSNIPVPPAALTIHGPITVPGTVVKDATPLVKTKEQQIEDAKARDKQFDREYKDLKNKPKWVLHPIKRADLYIDYHQNQYRKFRTRIIPATQFIGVMVGMGFSVASAL